MDSLPKKQPGSKYEAVLVDLDGTLLDIDLDGFIFTYVDKLAKRFAGLIAPGDFVRHLFGSTAVMVQNSDPGKKNSEVFYEDFCERIGFTAEKIMPIIDDFYLRDFPRLSCWGRSLPHTPRVIRAAREKGLPLVLATNPIFPPAAVYQRMAWAGLKEDQFRLITTMDNMHYCKPNPDYYLEIAEIIGYAPEHCLMAGNDTLEDLVAARVGMETYLVEDFILERQGVEPVSDYRGSLKEFGEFMAQL